MFFPLLIPVLLLTSQLSSCIYVTRVHDEPKTSVSFASAKAAQDFFEATYVPESSGKNMAHLGLGCAAAEVFEPRRDSKEIQ